MSSLIPCEAMYQYAANASPTPTSAAHGSHTKRQRRLRQPIAAISTSAGDDLHRYRNPTVHQRKVVAQRLG